MQYGAEHFAVEGWADIRIGGVANTEHAADVEQLDRVAHSELRRQMSRVAAQRLAVPECADNDVTLVDGGHAARGQFELVVTRLVVEHAHGDEYAFLARNVGRQPQLVAEVAVLRDRRDLVDDDGFHNPAPPARVCNEPGSDSMRA